MSKYTSKLITALKTALINLALTINGRTISKVYYGIRDGGKIADNLPLIEFDILRVGFNPMTISSDETDIDFMVNVWIHGSKNGDNFQLCLDALDEIYSEIFRKNTAFLGYGADKNDFRRTVDPEPLFSSFCVGASMTVSMRGSVSNEIE